MEQLGFFLVGVLGAVFANSTGAGGGVVFIPLFHELGFSSAQSVATSFGIQCFGMTTGAIAWSHHYREVQRPQNAWGSFVPGIGITLPFSVLGIWLVFGFAIRPPAETVLVFAVFSLVLGCAIILVSLRRDPDTLRQTLLPMDAFALVPIAFAGGIVTAWLSVGVGEFVAFYLILRRYDVTLSIAIAVVLSALSVWSAAPAQLVMGDTAVWPVILAAGPGAIVGAVLARRLALAMNTLQLKRFFGVWLLLMGLAELLARS
jgi:uncharacterized membrane protein YfcA